MRKLSLVLAVGLVLSLSTSVMAQDKPPGCPDGFFPMMSKELASACKGEMAGKVVTIGGTQDTNDAINFQNSFKEFEDWTGITVAYNGGKQFEGVIAAEVAGGQAPDMADFPQPGLVEQFSKQGKIVDVSTFLDPAWLKQNYAQFWLDLAMLPVRMASLSWLACGRVTASRVSYGIPRKPLMRLDTRLPPHGTR